MVTPESSCVFVHIPKTGGQSIERFFLHRANLTWQTRASFLLRPNKDPNQGPQRLAHLTAQEYVNCGHMSQNAFDRAFKFSIVRNPWSKLVSEFVYSKQRHQQSFAEFVATPLPTNKYSDRYRHLAPQFDYLYDNSGHLLVDYVGRFESLEASFAEVCQKLNLPTDSRLPFTNRTRSTSDVTDPNYYTRYYDNALRDLVGEKYERDIELFGYRFGE